MTVYTGNGINFDGAQSELKAVYNLQKDLALHHFASDHKIY